MAVFGMDILANGEHYPQQISSFGKPKSAAILNVISVVFRNWKIKVGK